MDQGYIKYQIRRYHNKNYIQLLLYQYPRKIENSFGKYWQKMERCLSQFIHGIKYTI